MVSPPPLRDYQIRAITMLRERHRDRPLLCVPTGAGKTSIAAEVIRSAITKGGRCIFLVHRQELVDQAQARLAEYGVLAGRIHAGHPEERHLPAQVACIPTLVRRKHWPASLVIVDECSHAVSESWAKVIGRYSSNGMQETDALIIGLTATPIRLDGKGLGDIFGCILEPVSIRTLIEHGYLVEPKVFAPPVDLAGVHIRAGDYALPELAERMSKLTGSITGEWMVRARGMKTVAFAVNVEHSKLIVEAFQALGVRAAHIDGGTANHVRAGTLAALKAGDLDIVSNCMVLSEGWDLPSLQCAVLARPTKSLALFRQMVGRVMRPPGPVLVLDHAGNHHEHGAVTDAKQWSLDTRQKLAASEPVRTCPTCFAVLPPGALTCSECGADLPSASQRDPPEVENPGELTEFAARDAEEEKAFYLQQVRDASRWQRAVGWARYRFKDRYGVWPKLYDIERENYTCPGHDWEQRAFGRRLVMRCKRCYAEEPADDPYLADA